jgi:hypothetical protein
VRVFKYCGGVYKKWPKFEGLVKLSHFFFLKFFNFNFSLKILLFYCPKRPQTGSFWATAWCGTAPAGST